MSSRFSVTFLDILLLNESINDEFLVDKETGNITYKNKNGELINLKDIYGDANSFIVSDTEPTGDIPDNAVWIKTKDTPSGKKYQMYIKGPDSFTESKPSGITTDDVIDSTSGLSLKQLLDQLSSKIDGDIQGEITAVKESLTELTTNTNNAIKSLENHVNGLDLPAHYAKEIKVLDANNLFTSEDKNVENVVKELFTSVSDGIKTVGAAIPDKRIVLPDNPTYEEVANAIKIMEAGIVINGTTGEKDTNVTPLTDIPANTLMGDVDIKQLGLEGLVNSIQTSNPSFWSTGTRVRLMNDNTRFMVQGHDNTDSLAMAYKIVGNDIIATDKDNSTTITGSPSPRWTHYDKKTELLWILEYNAVSLLNVSTDGKITKGARYNRDADRVSDMKEGFSSLSVIGMYVSEDERLLACTCNYDDVNNVRKSALLLFYNYKGKTNEYREYRLKKEFIFDDYNTTVQPVISKNCKFIAFTTTDYYSLPICRLSITNPTSPDATIDIEQIPGSVNIRVPYVHFSDDETKIFYDGSNTVSAVSLDESDPDYQSILYSFDGQSYTQSPNPYEIISYNDMGHCLFASANNLLVIKDTGTSFEFVASIPTDSLSFQHASITADGSLIVVVRNNAFPRMEIYKKVDSAYIRVDDNFGECLRGKLYDNGNKMVIAQGPNRHYMHLHKIETGEYVEDFVHHEKGSNMNIIDINISNDGKFAMGYSQGYSSYPTLYEIDHANKKSTYYSFTVDSVYVNSSGKAVFPIDNKIGAIINTKAPFITFFDFTKISDRKSLIGIPFKGLDLTSAPQSIEFHKYKNINILAVKKSSTLTEFYKYTSSMVFSKLKITLSGFNYFNIYIVDDRLYVSLTNGKVRVYRINNENDMRQISDGDITLSFNQNLTFSPNGKFMFASTSSLRSEIQAYRLIGGMIEPVTHATEKYTKSYVRHMLFDGDNRLIVLYENYPYISILKLRYTDVGVQVTDVKHVSPNKKLTYTDTPLTKDVPSQVYTTWKETP